MLPIKPDAGLAVNLDPVRNIFVPPGSGGSIRSHVPEVQAYVVLELDHDDGAGGWITPLKNTAPDPGTCAGRQAVQLFVPVRPQACPRHDRRVHGIFTLCLWGDKARGELR